MTAGEGRLTRVMIPINSKDVEDFIKDNKLFQRTQEMMIECLKNTWADSETDFMDELRADLQTVLEKYEFIHHTVSFRKNYDDELPVDYIVVWIRIHDDEDGYVCEYMASYDRNLECIEGKLID